MLTNNLGEFKEESKEEIKNDPYKQVIYSMNLKDTHSKLRQIIFIKFYHQSTITPVFKIEKNKMDILEKWYEDCDLLFDIEETNVYISDNVNIEKYSEDMLFGDFPCKYKNEYLDNYIPSIIKTIDSIAKLNSLDRLIFNKDNNLMNPNVKGKKTILDYGIVVPENTKLTFDIKKNSDKNNFYVTLPKKNENGFWSKCDMSDFIEPKGGFKVKSNVNNTVNEPVSYNSNMSSLLESNLSCSSLISEESDDFRPRYSVMKNDKINIHVLLYTKNLHTFVIKNPKKDELDILNNHPEFGFIDLFSYETNNNDIIKFIEQQFHHVRFIDDVNSVKIDDINKKLKVLDSFIGIFNNSPSSGKTSTYSLEEEAVRKYLFSNYTFDNDISHKMKASALYDLFNNTAFINPESGSGAGFKTRLASYLTNIGLQKKRFNDGFYYYGIVEKKDKNDMNDMVKSVEEYSYMKYK
jgi:hypothetical protein